MGTTVVLALDDASGAWSARGAVLRVADQQPRSADPARKTATLVVPAAERPWRRYRPGRARCRYCKAEDVETEPRPYGVAYSLHTGPGSVGVCVKSLGELVRDEDRRDS